MCPLVTYVSCATTDKQIEMLLGAWTHVHTLNHVLSGARIPRPRTKEHFWGHLGMPRLVCGRYSQFYSLGGISEAVYGYQYCSKCNETVQSAFFHWRISASLPTLHTHHHHQQQQQQRSAVSDQCSSTVYSRHLLGGFPPPRKKLTIPQTAAKLCTQSFW